MNNEGLIYLNTNIKIHALKVKLYQRMKEHGERLYRQAEKCGD